MDHDVTAIKKLSHILQGDAKKTSVLCSHVANLGGLRNNWHEFETLLTNNLLPNQKCITKENKLHYFQSLSRHEAMDFWQTMRNYQETTLEDVLNNNRTEIAKDDIKKVSKFKWHQLVCEPLKETFPKFLSTLRKTATQVFGGFAPPILW